MFLVGAEAEKLGGVKWSGEEKSCHLLLACNTTRNERDHAMIEVGLG